MATTDFGLKIETMQFPYYFSYEGRSINKLQNGAIPSVLKIKNIRNVRFVGNLILNIHII